MRAIFFLIRWALLLPGKFTGKGKRILVKNLSAWRLKALQYVGGDVRRTRNGRIWIQKKRIYLKGK